MDPEILAGKMYDAYCQNVGGKAFNGDLLPVWSEFRADVKKVSQSNAWIAAAQVAIQELTPK